MIDHSYTPGQTSRTVSGTGPEQTMVAAAISFTERKLPVLPLHTPSRDGTCSCRRHCGKNAGKHPRTRNGLSDATTDSERVLHWWSMWPDANIGIVTGQSAGIVVLDIDHAAGGWDSISALESQYGFLPHAPVVVTGGGGAHVYFRHSGARLPNSVGKLGPGLDIRGDGGFVVAPPSTHCSGSRYAWHESLNLDHVQPVALPAWLDSLIRTPAPQETTPHSERDTQAIPEGTRNSTLTRLAGSMRRHGISEEAILAALLIENAKRCQPSLPDSEVAKIAQSVGRYPPAMAPSRAQGRFVEFIGGRAVAR